MTVNDEATDLLSGLPEPWEQMAEETGPAFAAFVRYRDLPGEVRTIRRAAEDAWGEPRAKRGKFDTLESRFERYASAHHWRMRAQLWDAARDRARLEAEIVAVREMGARHAKVAMRIIDEGLKALDTIKPEHLSGSDVLRYLEVGVKLERLARGEGPTPDELPDRDEAPQDTIRALLESDPEVARAGARFGAQILRVRREREAQG